jgi:multiple sugar transport system permease protein
MSTTLTAARTMDATARRDLRAARRRKLLNAVLIVVLIVLSLAWLVPLAATVLTSLRRFDSVLISGMLSVEGGLTLDNFITVWQNGIDKYILNSFIITIPALAAVLILATSAAFVLSRFEIPYARTIMLLMLAGNLLPQQVLLIPYNKMAESLGIYDSYLAVILAHVGFQLGFFTFVLYNFIRQLPGELFEAAYLDGCGLPGMYRRILLPLLRPALAALGTLGFTWIFNDLLWALALIRSSGKFPVTAGLLQLQGQYVTDWTLLSAAALIAAVPTLFLFILLQRQFVSGLTFGSVK